MAHPHIFLDCCLLFIGFALLHSDRLKHVLILLSCFDPCTGCVCACVCAFILAQTAY